MYYSSIKNKSFYKLLVWERFYVLCSSLIMFGVLNKDILNLIIQRCDKYETLCCLRRCNTTFLQLVGLKQLSKVFPYEKRLCTFYDIKAQYKIEQMEKIYYTFSYLPQIRQIYEAIEDMASQIFTMNIVAFNSTMNESVGLSITTEDALEFYHYDNSIEKIAIIEFNNETQKVFVNVYSNKQHIAETEGDVDENMVLIGLNKSRDNSLEDFFNVIKECSWFK